MHLPCGRLSRSGAASGGSIPRRAPSSPPPPFIFLPLSSQRMRVPHVYVAEPGSVCLALCSRCQPPTHCGPHPLLEMTEEGRFKKKRERAPHVHGGGDCMRGLFFRAGRGARQCAGMREWRGYVWNAVSDAERVVKQGGFALSIGAKIVTCCDKR